MQRWAEDFLHFRFVEHLALFQCAGQGIELVALLSEKFSRSSIGFVQNSRNFLVDEPGRVFAELALFVNLAPRNGCSSPVWQATGPTFSLMPQWATIRRANRVTWFKSLEAPELYSSKISFSAARPPKAITNWLYSSVSPTLNRSSSGSSCVTPSARPRGMIVTLCSRSTPGRIQASSAWPAS